MLRHFFFVISKHDMEIFIFKRLDHMQENKNIF